MWLFGYGSLMWDDWERRYACVRRVSAEAPGYRRIFNKKSLERWGTYDAPGLTLNLALHERDEDDPCRGIAFQFPDTRQAEIEDYLSVRETCMACGIAVALPDETVSARTYIYDGPRLIEHGLPLHKCARMILSAEGVAGSSYDYIRNVRAHLEGLGVVDREVDTLWRAVLALKNGDRDD